MPKRKQSNNDKTNEIIDKKRKIEQQKIEEIERQDDLDYGPDKSGVGVGTEDKYHDQRTREYESQDKVREEMNKRRGRPDK